MDTVDTIFINNAGLSILHPYLTVLFERLNLLNSEKQFKDDSSTERAITLLQFLTTGNDVVDESILAFNKLLCGWPVNKAMSSINALSEGDKEMCNSLLEAVIQNWNSLGDTTIHGLRENFLVREGMLSQDQEQWTLKVEQKAYDLLLTQLPWSIAQISAPWIPESIKVDWK